MRRRRIRRPSSSSGAVAALAVFAILCGALVFAGSFRASSSERETVQPPGADRAEVTRAIGHLEQAANALEATDYGRTRYHLREGQRSLADALHVTSKGD